MPQRRRFALVLTAIAIAAPTLAQDSGQLRPETLRVATDLPGFQLPENAALVRWACQMQVRLCSATEVKERYAGCLVVDGSRLPKVCTERKVTRSWWDLETCSRKVVDPAKERPAGLGDCDSLVPDLIEDLLEKGLIDQPNDLAVFAKDCSMPNPPRIRREVTRGFFFCSATADGPRFVDVLVGSVDYLSRPPD